MKHLTVCLALLFSVGLFAQPDSLNMTKLGLKTYPNTLSDVWGWVDTAQGKEYALVGSQAGFSMVDVTNPSQPDEKFFINGAFSLWKDLKTFGHYGYMGHDFQFAWSTLPNDGILIVNLDSLQNPHYTKFTPTITLQDGTVDSLQTSHNIFIDENGILYVFGASSLSQPIYNGGALMFDLKPDPMNPVFLGAFDDFYLHDGYVRNDTLYGGAINIGVLAVIDVRQKSNPIVLATKATPNAFAHNTWLSDDGNTVYTTDEKPNAYIAAYDVSDVNNITELDKIRTLPGTDLIPHNVHVLGDFLVTSYYTRGCHIVDAKYPDLLVEVGYYDTSPNFSGNGYNGAWGAYPFLPSGNILISDMEEGLHILKFDTIKAGRVYGIVVDSLTGSPITGANVDFVKKNVSTTTWLDGRFKAGSAKSEFETILASAAGYYPNVYSYSFVNGSTDSIIIKLLPLTFQTEENNIAADNIRLFPNPSHGTFTIALGENNQQENVAVSITNAQGRIVFTSEKQLVQKGDFNHNLAAGLYVVHIKTKAADKAVKLIVQ